MKKNKENLETIPGVGKSTARDLNMLGIRSVSDLKGRDPQTLYDGLCRITGKKQDRCVLYAYRCAVYFAEGGREAGRLKWWNWKDGRGKK